MKRVPPLRGLTHDSSTSRPRKVTLRDVARVASVDPSVVSRVINADPILTISADTRARVEAAIASTGYRPNVVARNLRMSRNHTLGLVLPDVTNPVYSPIVRGVASAAARAGYAVVLGSDLGPQPSVESFARLLNEGRVDGLLVSSGTVDDETIHTLVETSDLVVLVNRRLRGLGTSVVVDDAAGAQLAVHHLANLGHTAIGHIAGPPKVETSFRRSQGFAAGLKAAGIPQIRRYSAALDGWTATSGYSVAKRILSQQEPPTALFVANVTAAIGAIRAASDLGLSVPRDLSVIGLHDTEFADFLVPRLTTVAMPLEMLGEVAATVLIGILNGGPARGDVVVDGPPELVIRESTARPRSDRA